MSIIIREKCKKRTLLGKYQTLKLKKDRLENKVEVKVSVYNCIFVNDGSGNYRLEIPCMD